MCRSKIFLLFIYFKQNSHKNNFGSLKEKQKKSSFYKTISKTYTSKIKKNNSIRNLQLIINK